MKKVVSKTVGVILLALSLTTMSANAQTNNSKEVEVVNKMFQAFGSGNMEALKLTLSDTSVWVYYGSDLIPYSGTYKGKEEVVRFIGNIVSSVDILDFKVDQIISNGKTVVVLGSEKQKIKKNSKILEQNWVQVYTVENGLITKMDEYANTAYSEKLFKK
ncbi:MAG: nuclear transport factor 2 family protein [Leadbetterella sp.]|nr:nuclear transport factor 2 family protein [Leadbetterella sp.]